jgi:Mn2+/Fe2+ NRAMP family transporter
VVTAAVLKGVDIESAAQAAVGLMPFSKYAGTFMAIGLFDAGFLGAICISLSSSWAVGEVFGWAHSLNNKVREAPWFYMFYFFMLVTAGVVVLIPGAPLVTITLFVQVVATTLLPAALVFLILLLNNEELMGQHRNTRFDNVVNFGIVIGLILLSTGYTLTTLFPNWLH